MRLAPRTTFEWARFAAGCALGIVLVALAYAIVLQWLEFDGRRPPPQRGEIVVCGACDG